MNDQNWTLYLWKPSEKYPSKVYFWVDPDDRIRFVREILPMGFMPSVPLTEFKGMYLSEARKHIRDNWQGLKNVRKDLEAENKEENEYLSKGILIR